MLSRVSELHWFLWLSNDPLDAYTTFCGAIRQSGGFLIRVQCGEAGPEQ